jgi:hypothetical protein
MKKRLLLVCAATLVLASAAFADSNLDPTIIVKDPACTGTCTPVGMQFTFSTPASGLGMLLFNNNSGVNWTSLKLIESGVPANLITCLSPGAFASCSVNTVNGVTTILLSGVGSGFLGIPAGHNFSITFGCGPNVTGANCGPWPGNLAFQGFANPIPEPATIALVLTGLGGIITRRKWLTRA